MQATFYGVCSDCKFRVGRVKKGLPPDLPKYKKYERMKVERPDEYQKKQEELYKLQLAKVNEKLNKTLKPINKGKLSNWQEVADKVVQYFESTALATDLDPIDKRHAAPPTLTGLANALGVSVQAIRTYQNRDFVDADDMTIKTIIQAAIQLIAQYAEEKIYSHQFSGAKYHLSKILPDIFGESDTTNILYINTIGDEQKNRVLQYLAHKNSVSLSSDNDQEKENENQVNESDIVDVDTVD